MRQFFVVGGVSLWCRAFLSRGGGFLSNARNSAGAGRNKHTPLASEVHEAAQDRGGMALLGIAGR